jgi:uncharacterized membrane protein (DUF485 family)
MEFETPPLETQNISAPPPPESSSASPSPEQLKKQRQIVFSIIAVVVIFLTLTIVAIVWLAQPSTATDKVRDIFIIFMALETLVIGFVLVILTIQVARLINLLQNEIKPILNTTNETVNTLRGTVLFLSDNLAEPVVKANEYMAALQTLREALGFGKKKV